MDSGRNGTHSALHYFRWSSAILPKDAPPSCSKSIAMGQQPGATITNGHLQELSPRLGDRGCDYACCVPFFFSVLLIYVNIECEG